MPPSDWSIGRLDQKPVRARPPGRDPSQMCPSCDTHDDRRPARSGSPATNLGVMGVADGTYALGPEVGSILVKTTRTGVGAKVGHDLTLEPTRWRGTTVVDADDLARSSVTAEVDVDSLEIKEASGGVKPLTDTDRADIKKNLRKALDAAQHPMITFRSTRLAGSPEAFTIDGDLTIAGSTQPVTVRGHVTDSRARGGTTVVQSRWGIKPYSAFFGALKLRDEVEVEFDVALTPAATG